MSLLISMFPFLFCYHPQYLQSRFCQRMCYLHLVMAIFECSQFDKQVKKFFFCFFKKTIIIAWKGIIPLTALSPCLYHKHWYYQKSKLCAALGHKCYMNCTGSRVWQGYPSDEADVILHGVQASCSAPCLSLLGQHLPIPLWFTFWL